MGYSDRNSSGGAVAGAAGTFITIVLAVLVVGLKVAARASRNSYRNSYNHTPATPPRNLPLTREEARRTTIVSRGEPVNNYAPVEPSPPVPSEPEDAARRQAAWQEQEANRQAQNQSAPFQPTPVQPGPVPEGSVGVVPTVQPQPVDPAAQRQAEMEQREREFAAQEAAKREAARNPQPVLVPQQGAGGQPGAVVDAAPPGFAVTAIDQVKPKSTVFARAQDGWFPAVVTRRVGAEVTVRYTTNGVIDRVSVNRIRLQSDPTAPGADDGRPAALKPVAVRDPANKPEAEDDALIVAKPKKDPELGNEPVVVAPAARPAAKGPAAGMVRTWTNDTGEFKVEAELISFEFDLVQLKKADGKVISIRIEKLSADDQAFVRSKFP